MSFEWLSLEQGEEVLWEGRPRIQSIIPALVVGVPLSVVGIGLVVIASAYLRIQNTDFVVTTEGLYRKSGILSRDVQKIGFDKVQNISFSQTALGNYFGYGNVEISTAGGSGVEMRFRNIEDPKKVQQLINQRIKSETQDGSTEGGSDLQREMLQELRRIRKLLENSP